jgi:hypothetical protein
MRKLRGLAGLALTGGVCGAVLGSGLVLTASEMARHVHEVWERLLRVIVQHFVDPHGLGLSFHDHVVDVADAVCALQAVHRVLR